MSIIIKMCGYSYLALALCAYLGLKTTTIMPPALVNVDASFGGYVRANLDFFNEVGEEHLGALKAKFLQ